MTLDFLRLPTDERKAYIDEAAARRGLSPVVLEKDFWVCFLLRLLFASSFRDAIVFKGGTALSKVFGVIERFSEDIDLSLSPSFLDLVEPGLIVGHQVRHLANRRLAHGHRGQRCVGDERTVQLMVTQHHADRALLPHQRLRMR